MSRVATVTGSRMVKEPGRRQRTSPSQKGNGRGVVQCSILSIRGNLDDAGDSDIKHGEGRFLYCGVWK